MLDIPFRLFVSIIAGFFIGRFIDDFFSMEVPVFTIIFSVFGLIGGIWSCLKKT